MATKKLPSYRLHKASGQAKVTLAGKDFYLGPFGSSESKQRYATLIAEFEASNRSTVFKAAELTMSQVCLAYLEFALPYYGAESSEYDNLKRATTPVAHLYSQHAAKAFGPAEFKACRQWWLSDSDRSRQYVNQMTAKLRRVIKWAVSESYMSAENYLACKCVEPIKVGRTTAPESVVIKSVDDARVNAVLEHVSPVVADMIRFQRLTGARPGEVCNLKPSDIDRSTAEWTIRLTEHKTAHQGKLRTIFVGPIAQKILTPYLFRDADAFCFSPAESAAQKRKEKSAKRVTPLSCGNKPGSNRKKRPTRTPGNHYDARSYAKAIKYGCSKAFPQPKGLKGRALTLWRKANWFAPNQLRHNRATEIRAELGLEAASATLGHSSQQITLTYAEEALELARKAARMSG